MRRPNRLIECLTCCYHSTLVIFSRFDLAIFKSPCLANIFDSVRFKKIRFHSRLIRIWLFLRGRCCKWILTRNNPIVHKILNECLRNPLPALDFLVRPANWLLIMPSDEIRAVMKL